MEELKLLPAPTAKAPGPAQEYKTPSAGAATPFTVAMRAIPSSLPGEGIQFVEAVLLVVIVGNTLLSRTAIETGVELQFAKVCVAINV